ncbi:hypothetical protein GGQ68_001791 [Sagittula marina]|uniref:Uncharacterized protein n=1 Tax=Sagittula marina TaxID=943940 RepID=A0A7W6GSC3_9RHOB|nr:hypothetical protein [Sagittula marina]
MFGKCSATPIGAVQHLPYVWSVMTAEDANA